jgi:hypothetical protein
LLVEIKENQMPNALSITEIESIVRAKSLHNKGVISYSEFKERISEYLVDYCDPDIPGDEEAFWKRSADRDRKRRGEV